MSASSTFSSKHTTSAVALSRPPSSQRAHSPGLSCVYAKNGRLDLAKQLFDHIPQRNLVCWTALLTAYAQYGHPDKVKDMFDRDLVCWNGMLGLSSDSGNIHHARRIFTEMRERNLLSWTAMLAANAHYGYYSEAEILFKLMPERDLVSCTAMIVAYSQSFKLDKAEIVFEAMPERDIVSWTAMLAAYTQNGDIPIASRLHAGEILDGMELHVSQEMKKLCVPRSSAFSSPAAGSGSFRRV